MAAPAEEPQRFQLAKDAPGRSFSPRETGAFLTQVHFPRNRQNRRIYGIQPSALTAAIATRAGEGARGDNGPQRRPDM
jgi:hypothetical protein